MWVGAAFLVLPLVEIALFVVVGGWIGLWSTLAVVIGSGILGVTLLRRMGAPSLGVVRGDLLSPLAERALLAVAAMLLILPGFLADTPCWIRAMCCPSGWRMPRVTASSWPPAAWSPPAPGADWSKAMPARTWQ